MPFILLLHPLHRQLYPFPFHIDAEHLDAHMLVDRYHLIGVGDEPLGKLGEVYQSVLFDAYVHEGAEVRDVSHDAGQFHAFAQVVDGAHVLVELE